MALTQTRSKGRGVAVGDTWGKEKLRLGEGRVGDREKGKVGIVRVARKGTEDMGGGVLRLAPGTFVSLPSYCSGSCLFVYFSRQGLSG